MQWKYKALHCVEWGVSYGNYFCRPWKEQKKVGKTHNTSLVNPITMGTIMTHAKAGSVNGDTNVEVGQCLSQLQFINADVSPHLFTADCFIRWCLHNPHPNPNSKDMNTGKKKSSKKILYIKCVCQDWPCSFGHLLPADVPDACPPGFSLPQWSQDPKGTGRLFSCYTEPGCCVYLPLSSQHWH